MFIKLNFSTSRNFGQLMLVLGDIINNPNITSISTLQSEFVSRGYNAAWLANLDPLTSEIWRTADSSKVHAHISKPSSDLNSHSLVIEQSSYDNDNQKYYIRFSQSSTNSIVDIGNATGAAMTVPQFSLGGTTGAVGGTVFNVVNNAAGFTAIDSNGIFAVRTLWVYITNTSFVWAVTLNAGTAIGFLPNQASYSSLGAYSGPFFMSQYTRFDHHNNVFNGIVPVAFYNYRKLGGLTATDLVNVQNTGFSNNTSLPMMVYNFVDAYNQNGGYPVVLGPFVGLTSAGLSTNAVNCRSDLKTTGAVGTFTAPSIGGVYNPGTSVRRPTSDLLGSGIGLITLGWEELFRGNHGGNISERSGVYIFNGEYAPGDTFTLDNKEWIVWPMFNGFSSRLGLAVPKE
jgi:hypothetical protein